MKPVIWILFALLEIADARQTEWQPDWSACKKTSDCMHFKGCCEWKLIHKSFVSKVKKFEDEHCPLVECAFDGDPSRAPQIECKKNRCTTTESK